MSPGWYDDPYSYGWLRYWDGGSWTRDTAPRPAGYRSPSQALSQRPTSGAAALSPAGRFASFGSRLGAFLLDAIIVMLPVDILVSAIWMALNWDFIVSLSNSIEGGQALDFGQLVNAETGAAVAFGLLLGPVWFIYEYVTLRRWSATLGMKIVGIQVAPLAVVVPADTRTVTRRATLVRALVFGAVPLLNIVPVVGLLVVIAFLIDCVSMLADRQSQTWHDKAAGTVVVKRRG